MSPSADSPPPNHPKVVQTTLNYYLDPALGGHSEFVPGTAGAYRRAFDVQPVQISDIRGREGEFSLNTSGFQLYKHSSIEKDFGDEETVKSVVYPETEKLLRKVTGATKVHVFSHITRRHNTEEVASSIANLPDSAGVGKITPARFVHIDQSRPGAHEVLYDNMPAPFAEEIVASKKRWSIINVWRPITPVRRDPLAICDTRSVKDEDLVPITANLPPNGSGTYENVSAGKRFEILYAKANPEHRWYYAEGMGPEEVLLIKIFDSKKEGGLSVRAPHSSFVDPETRDVVGTRESIEVRSLVFWEDEVDAE